MLHYLAQRLLGALMVLFVVSVVAFGLYALTPGDPAVVLLEASGIHSPPREAIDAKRAELHLNDPMPVQYVNWIAGAVRGDFGRSFRSDTPVAELHLSRIRAPARPPAGSPGPDRGRAGRMDAGLLDRPAADPRVRRRAALVAGVRVADAS